MANAIQKVMITGVGGFIFSNFCRYVAYNQHDKYWWSTIDNYASTNSIKRRYKGRPFKDAQHYVADIRDVRTINAIFNMERPDIVIHAAAEASVDKSITEPDVFTETNVHGTQIIVDACVRYEVKKLIFTSTDEVYGAINSEADPSWTEASARNPRNPYSISKAEAEQRVIDAGQKYGLVYNITRSANNYGRYQTTDKLIPRVIKCIMNGQKIPIYGRGLQVRDWLYVDDNCKAIFKVMENGVPNEIYNVGANQELQNIEIVQRICNILDRGHDLIDFITDPRGDAHDFRYSMDSSKLKSLGWEPQVKLKEGLNETCEWYKNNQWARQ